MTAITTTTRATLAALGIVLSGFAGVASAAAANTNLPAVSVSGDSIASKVTAAVRDVVGDTSPDITVKNQDGAVTLGGWARNAEDVSKAVNVAASVAGVKQVYPNGVRLWSTRTGL